MQLLADLDSEHLFIERVLGALETWAKLRASGGGEASDGAGFLAFFRRYAGDFHHGKEERVLFPALVSTEVPADRGPLAVLLHAHQAMGKMLDELALVLTREVLDEVGRAELLLRARRYAAALYAHIDAERSVLIPESAIRFRTAAIIELETPPPTPEEEAARIEGERLATVHAPSELPGLFRGEGCVSCAGYGVHCDGIEREWWSEAEWEDTLERMGNG